MYTERPSKLFFRYALPQMFGLLLNSVYLVVDGIFIGNRLGRDAMAAAAVSVPVIEFCIAVSITVSVGAGVMISGRLGIEDKVGARRIFHSSVWLMAIIGLLFMAAGNLFIDPIARLMGSTNLIHLEATSYLRYIVTFSPFLMFSFLLSGLARTDNQPTLAMVALGVGSVLNIILDYVFMYPLQMGIAGAALATAIGPVVSVAIVLPHFIRKKGNLYFAKLAPKLLDWKHIIKIGFPAFVMEFSIGLVTFIYNFAIVHYKFGEIGLAAYLVIGYLALIILSVFLGIAQGLQPIFSFWHGKGEEADSKNLFIFSAKAVFLIGVVLFLLLLLFSEYFIGIFSPQDRQLIEFTTNKVPQYFFGFTFAGLNIMLISYWQAKLNVAAATIVSLLRSIILLPILMCVLPLFFGNNAIWVVLSITELLTLLVATVLFLRRRNRAISK